MMDPYSSLNVPIQTNKETVLQILEDTLALAFSVDL